jgi:prepilin-type N-terminal cleavage/methylation domain-containing protein/prepilin-type processing-associated H-X9-DG protein
MHRRALGKGFTLTEVLVVLTIVTVLATILFAVFSRARESGRRSACQSNLRLLASSTLQYLQDYDYRYPSNEFYRVWLTSYVKNTQIYFCPSINIQDPYLYNVDRLIYYPSMSSQIGQHDSALPQTSKIWMQCDRILLSEARDTFSFPGCWNREGMARFEVAQRHVGGSNFSFLDGHVKWLKAKDLAINDCSLSPVAGVPLG